MKNLSNCTPVEFLSQSYKISNKIKDLFKKANVSKIRKTKIEFTGTETKEEKEQKIQEQGRKNISEIMEKLLVEFPQETAEVLGAMCFIEPADLEKYSGFELASEGLNMLNDKEVLNFLFSLMKLGKTNISV